jgi:peroxiredoxin
MFGQHSPSSPAAPVHRTGRFRFAVAAVLLTSLLFLGGCSEPLPYVITDETSGISVAGVPLTDADLETLVASEAEAQAQLLAGDYLKAAETYQKQLPVLTGHFIAEYKVAAAYAQAGQVDEALRWLKQSVKNGFANVGRLDTDPALESLHGEERAVPIYRDARENMTVLQTKIQQDPWTAAPAQPAVFDDLQTLLNAFSKEEAQLDRLEGVFFDREFALRRILTHRGKAEALEAFIAAGGRNAAETEQARIELLRVYRLHAQGPRPSAVAEAKLDEGCRSYIKDYPAGHYLPEVKLLHAEYRFLSGLRRLSGAQREEIPRMCEEFRGEARAIVEQAPGDPAAGLALVWLTELDFDPRFGQRNLAAALENYRRLENEYLQIAEVAEQAAARVPALGFFDHGLPEFEVDGMDGEKISIGQYRGKVLLLFFWSTTSKPAKDEIANLKWIEEKFQDKGLAVVGVSLDEGDLLSSADFSRWVEANTISWPQFYDGRGADNQLAGLFRVSSVPFVFVIQRDGTLADAGLTGKDLEQAVAEIVE